MGDDFGFVHADERAEDRRLGGLVYDGDVAERLRRDLPEAFAGYERVGALFGGERLGDADHKAAVGDDAERAGRFEDDLVLDAGERNEEQARVVLPCVEERREVFRLAAGAPLDEREGVKVDEDGLAAAPHHPPCGDGGVDAAGQQRRDFAADADGQPARAGDFVGVDESVLAADLDAEVDVGADEVHAGAGRLADGVAEPDVEVVGCERKALVGAVGGDAERGEGAGAGGFEEQALDVVVVGLGAGGEAELDGAEHLSGAAADLAPVGVGGEAHSDHHPGRPDAFDAGACGRAPQVFDEAAREGWLVAAFQSDFVEPDERVARGVHWARLLRGTPDSLLGTGSFGVIGGILFPCWPSCPAFWRERF